ncbi:MAG TPA: DUF885 domain-containing protein [Candidatus Acidoferrum sp.]|nr:DUF885 domain-containing protein [Candidatus Acidoferrum sp.]
MTQEASPKSAPDRIDAFADRFWQSILELQPTTATVYGDERYADRLEDPSPAGRAKALALWQRTRQEADALHSDELSVEDRITLHMVGVVCDLAMEQQQQRTDVLAVVDQMGGPQTLLPVITQFQKADTPARFEAYEARIRAYPAYMAANIDLLHEGLASGLTAPRIVVERTVAQLERLLESAPDESPVVAMAQVSNDADRATVGDLVRDVVRPADIAFLDALKGDYLAASRTDPGLWSAPNGEALYRTAVRAWTTVQMDPADIHRIGLDDLEAIEEERRVIAGAAGFGDDTSAYRAALDADASNTPNTKAELIGRAAEDIERAMALAPRYFGRLPKAGCEVRPVEDFKEADSPFAYYFPPASDGSRKGIYYANGYDLPSRKYTKLASTTYHEAVPGHHFQIALEMENPKLNTFRRLGSRLVGAAFAEGWGLYSERLADEMGLYRSEAERFGMLDAQAWRAARLVVDTGMHALRWTRQQSVDFLLGTGLSQTDATIETDRYICWPAQALTYKLGQRVIEQLRRDLSARDGARFDLREFHDQVLGHGSLPLATLARELPTWVASPV